MTVAGHRLAHQHQQHQIALGAAAVGLFAGLLDRVRSGDLTEEQFLALCTATQQAAFTTSAQTAVVFVTDFRTIQDPDTTHAAPIEARFDTQRGLARSTTALDELRRVDAAAQATIINRLAAGLQRHVLAGGRETVQASARANGVGWRRITDGNPCAFCAMVSLNIYDTEEAASRVTGRHRRKRPIGSQFHDHCGCSVVEAVGDWEDDPQTAQYQALYDTALDACEKKGIPPTPANIQAQMREHGHGIINDAHIPENQRKKPGPKPQAGGAGGNGDGGRKPPWLGASGGGDGNVPAWWDDRAFDKVWHGNISVRPNGSARLRGGHRPGKGWRNKTEFPPSWDRKVLEEALVSTWNDPDAWFISGDRVAARKTVKGVVVEVTAYGDGVRVFRSVVPISGEGVVRNTPNGPVAVPLDETYLRDRRWNRRG